MSELLERYREIVGGEQIDSIRRLAAPLGGKRLVHVNATRVGGGVAEILHRLSPMMKELHIDVAWEVIQGSPEFYTVTKKFHNALHGVEVQFTREDFEVFEAGQAQNREHVALETADFVVIHDPQPVGLVEKRHPGSHWIWRCHIDIEHAQEDVWGNLKPLVDRYDGVLFHLPQYVKPVRGKAYLVPPAIDALSEKNRSMTPEEVDAELEKMGIPRDLPIIAQVSRYDRLKDPIGVIQAWRLVKQRVPCRLVLLGGAADDDPEAVEVLAEVREMAGQDPLIHVLDLAPDSHTAVNALQRGATVVVQKSLREGFGLVVTEAMWKGKATVGGDVGGIRHQIRHHTSGMLARTVEGCALQILELLAEPQMRKNMGLHARESVLCRYLLPTLLQDYLKVMRSVAGIEERG